MGKDSVAADVRALLAGLGVVPASARDGVVEVVASEARLRGWPDEVKVVSVRGDAITLSTGHQTACMLRLDGDRLLDRVNRELGSGFRRLNVRIA